MPQREFEKQYAELRREIDALEMEFADPNVREHFADVRRWKRMIRRGSHRGDLSISGTLGPLLQRSLERMPHPLRH